MQRLNSYRTAAFFVYSPAFDSLPHYDQMEGKNIFIECANLFWFLLQWMEWFHSDHHFLCRFRLRIHPLNNLFNDILLLLGLCNSFVHLFTFNLFRNICRKVMDAQNQICGLLTNPNKMSQSSIFMYQNKTLSNSKWQIAPEHIQRAYICVHLSKFPRFGWKCDSEAH